MYVDVTYQLRGTKVGDNRVHLEFHPSYHLTARGWKPGYIHEYVSATDRNRNCQCRCAVCTCMKRKRGKYRFTVPTLKKNDEEFEDWFSDGDESVKVNGQTPW